MPYQRLQEHIFRYTRAPEKGGIGTERERELAKTWMPLYDVHASRQGESTQELMERLGKPEVVLGLAEGAVVVAGKATAPGAVPVPGFPKL